MARGPPPTTAQTSERNERRKDVDDVALQSGPAAAAEPGRATQREPRRRQDEPVEHGVVDVAVERGRRPGRGRSICGSVSCGRSTQAKREVIESANEEPVYCSRGEPAAPAAKPQSQVGSAGCRRRAAPADRRARRASSSRRGRPPRAPRSSPSRSGSERGSGGQVRRRRPSRPPTPPWRARAPARPARGRHRAAHSRRPGAPSAPASPAAIRAPPPPPPSAACRGRRSRPP